MSEYAAVNAGWRAQASQLPADTRVFWVAPPSGRSYDTIFLNAMESASDRQYHNCRLCRHFLNHYAGLCYIQDGKQIPLFWKPIENARADVAQAFAALHAAVSTGSISHVHVFNPDLPTLGNRDSGGFVHFYYELPKQLCRNVREVRDEAFEMLSRILADNSRQTVDSAYALLVNHKVPRAEGHKAHIVWLRELMLQLEAEADVAKQQRLKWDALARAVTGCLTTLRSGVVAQMMLALQQGKGEAEAARIWEELTAPGRYMRATVAPSEGTLATAERLCAEVGITKQTLQRRFLKEAPARAVLWSKTPRAPKRDDADADDFVSIPLPSGAARPERLFGHIQARTMPSPGIDHKTSNDKPTAISLLGLLSKLDANTCRLEFQAGRTLALYSFVVAAHADSDDGRIPLMSWHNRHNTASWYTWPDADSETAKCGLRLGWNDVTEVLKFPHLWDDDEKFKHRGRRYLFALQGAKDDRALKAGGVLFPELMDSKFHEIRSVICAHNDTAQILGSEEPYVCGIGVDVDHVGQVFRVTTRDGIYNTYTVSSFE